MSQRFLAHAALTIGLCSFGASAMAQTKCTNIFATTIAESAVASTKVLELNSGKKIFAEVRILNPSKPTLVLLPGLYRGVNNQDPIYKHLLESDLNWVALHFSTHPQSLIESQSSPAAKISLDDLYLEMSQAIKTLGIKKPIPVTLSYSSAIGHHFKSSPNMPVIETGPIGKYNEELGPMGSFAESWSGIVTQIPGGADWIRQMQNTSYQTYWSEIALGMAAYDPRILWPLNFSKVTDGYVKMAQAIENYDFRNKTWKDESPRYFFIGQLENPLRLKNQKEGIQNYWKQTGLKPFVVVAQWGQHNVGRSNPVAYFEFLELIASNQLNKRASGAFIKADGKIDWWNEQDLKDFLSN